MGEGPCSGGKWSPEENEKPLKGLKQRRAKVRWGEVSGSGGSFAGPLDFVELELTRQGQPNSLGLLLCHWGTPSGPGVLGGTVRGQNRASSSNGVKILFPYLFFFFFF